IGTRRRYALPTRARVELTGDLRRLSELLDDDVALLLLDDPLDRGNFVTGRDRKANRRASDRFVFGDRELDLLDAVAVRALTEELEARQLVGELFDSFVHLTDEGLVLGSLASL